MAARALSYSSRSISPATMAAIENLAGRRTSPVAHGGEDDADDEAEQDLARRAATGGMSGLTRRAPSDPAEALKQ
jgi:hypothetical protein